MLCCVRAVFENCCCKVCISPFPALLQVLTFSSSGNNAFAEAKIISSKYFAHVVSSGLKSSLYCWRRNNIFNTHLCDSSLCHAAVEALFDWCRSLLSISAFTFRPRYFLVTFPSLFCMSLFLHFLQPSTLFIYILLTLLVLYEVQQY